MTTNFFSLFRLANWSIILVSCLLYIGCKHTDPNPASDLSADQLLLVQDLNKRISPIKDSDPTREFNELASLDTLFKQVQVVGMGESTHGSREFFQMKDRLFRYLVQIHQHQTLGFEANFGRSVQINRFIHGQTTSLTSASTAAKNLYFWPWATEEVSQLFQWMREYNASKGAAQQISFYGIDCQYADDEFPIIREFLAKVDPASVVKIDSVSNLFTLTIGATSPTFFQQYAQKIPELYSLFVQNETKWAIAGGRQDYEVAKQAARILIQQQDLVSGDACNYGIRRDKYMAENVQWILTKMNVSKLSLWAHTGHVANLPGVNCNQPSMGTYLKQQLKNQYLIIGTSLTSGSFTVRNGALTEAPITRLSIQGSVEPASYNYLLGKSQYPNYILNLQQVNSSTASGNWFNTQHPFLLVGASYDENKPNKSFYDIPLSTSLDVLIHFRDTTPTQRLP